MARPSVKDLMTWVKLSILHYPDVSITDMKASWQNGYILGGPLMTHIFSLGFAALIHAHEPTAIDYATLSADNPKKTIEAVIKVCTSEMPPNVQALQKVNVKVTIDADRLSNSPTLSLVTDQLVEYVDLTEHWDF